MCNECHMERASYAAWLKLDDNGLLHCKDGPALIYDDGGYGYFHHNMLHRVGGKPALFLVGQLVKYCVNGKEHRDGNLPAVIDIFTGDLKYYIDGVLARTDGGAAVEHPDGRGEYWENGEFVRYGYVQ